MRRLFVALPVIALAYAAHSQDVWGNAEIDAYVLARSLQQPTRESDPFAAPPIPTAPATHVIVEYSVRGQNEPQGKEAIDPASWTYNPTTNVMMFTIKAPPPTGASYPALHQGWIVYDQTVAEVTGRGTNAFGASTDIITGLSVSRGIAEASNDILDEIGPQPIQPSSPGDPISSALMSTGSHDYTFAYTINPDAGRELARHVRVQVAADTVAYRPNQWVYCHQLTFEPTFSSPVSGRSESCYLTTRVQSIRIIDNRDGTVLKEWKR